MKKREKHENALIVTLANKVAWKKVEEVSLIFLLKISIKLGLKSFWSCQKLLIQTKPFFMDVLFSLAVWQLKNV